MERLLKIALERSKIKIELDDKNKPQYELNAYEILPNGELSNDPIGYISFSAREGENNTDIHIRMIKTSKEFRMSTDLFEYLLDEFVKVIKQFRNPTIGNLTNIINSNLRKWLNDKLETQSRELNLNIDIDTAIDPEFIAGRIVAAMEDSKHNYDISISDNSFELSIEIPKKILRKTLLSSGMKAFKDHEINNKEMHRHLLRYSLSYYPKIFDMGLDESTERSIDDTLWEFRRDDTQDFSFNVVEKSESFMFYYTLPFVTKTAKIKRLRKG